VLLVWLAIVAIGGRRLPMSRIAALTVLVIGVGMLLAAVAYLGTSPTPAAAMALIIAMALGVWLAVQRFIHWRTARAGAPEDLR
jgi:energy-converting hydrogenase Eha subunit C